MTFDLAGLGWDDDFAARFEPYGHPWQRPARVVRVDRGVCTAVSEAGAERASVAGSLLSAAMRNPVAMPCTGDWVVLRTWPDERVTVEAVLPRRTAVVRAGSRAEAVAQVLAANIDTAAVVEPLDPSPDVGRIERLLALAWESGATPIVILTKADLVADAAAVADQISRVAPNVAVHAVSAESGTGLAPLWPLVAPGRTLGLLGRSGAGKSSLVNALAGAVVMGTQLVRRADGRGRHTTTHRALVPIPGGGAVLDTPGLRGVALGGRESDADDPSAGLDLAFADVAGLAARCRFGDCRHHGEPGCAVAEALRSGELTYRRWDSWNRLHKEIVFETRRHDARVAGEERAKWKRRRTERRVRGARP